MKTISLNGAWRFKAVNKYRKLSLHSRNVVHWMKATVPGTVHTDLLADKKIPDPFYRMNEHDIQWIDLQQWLYQKEFTVTPAMLREDFVILVAEGLDTYAAIMINGKAVDRTSNMFIEHRIDVKRYLHPGKNRIEILFDSPTIRSKKLEEQYGALRVALEPHRVYVRKAQYSFSWDWGPKITTSGIWRNISLQAFSGRLKNPFVKILSVDKREAVAEISVEIEANSPRSYQLRTFIAGNSVSLEVVKDVSGSTIAFRVHIPNPLLWWPNGYGKQPMYAALFSLLHDGNEIHQIEIPFAIRTVRLLQEKDTEGRSFIVEVNGVKIYCKGADWIPSDNCIPRISDATYETLLRFAGNAHMNMIRVWGGGIYEQDIFYNLCDQMGLMVWQDFMYACGEYPQAAWFLRQSKVEAEHIVKRLRNHPSIVLWCGNNECEWLFCTENPEKTADDMKGAKIFRDILPEACKKFDGTRPYWRSSPFGTGFPNAESNGNHHQWTVWSYWKDYKEYENDTARFISEFGFQAPANRRTFEEVTLPDDRHPQSPFMEHHNKQIEGTERLLRFQAAHFRLSNSFDGFIYKGQLVQAEALKCAVEHWRRRKFSTAGSLFWQLNDCWPVSSWAVIDSKLRPKAAYYAAKRFFAPMLLSFKQTQEGIEVWVTGDRLERFAGEINLQLISFRGNILWKKKLKISLASNSSKKFFLIPRLLYAKHDVHTIYLFGTLSRDRNIESTNRFFFSEPKYWKLPKGRAAVQLKKEKSGRWTVTIKAKTFLKGVRVEIDGEEIVFDDNYFDLDAGNVKSMTFDSHLTAAKIRKLLRVRWL